MHTGGMALKCTRKNFNQSFCVDFAAGRRAPPPKISTSDMELSLGRPQRLQLICIVDKLIEPKRVDLDITFHRKPKVKRIAN